MDVIVGIFHIGFGLHIPARSTNGEPHGKFHSDIDALKANPWFWDFRNSFGFWNGIPVIDKRLAVSTDLSDAGTTVLIPERLTVHVTRQLTYVPVRQDGGNHGDDPFKSLYLMEIFCT